MAPVTRCSLPLSTAARSCKPGMPGALISRVGCVPPRGPHGSGRPRRPPLGAGGRAWAGGAVAACAAAVAKTRDGNEGG
jgi:hypothetical protein